MNSNIHQDSKNIISKIIKKLKYKVPSYSHYSFSQCGEDLIVQYIFRLRGIDRPSYLDIGANDPWKLSNTALFYIKGSRGINIEPNPKLINEFYKQRHGDINLNIGIDNKEGHLDFYIMNDSTLSSFSRNECEKYINTGRYKIVDLVKVPVTTINKVLQQYNQGKFPDFLSLDAEGLDFDILKSIEFETSSPKVICVEAAEYSEIGAGDIRSELIEFLQSKGFYEYANTNLNAIMVKNDFWFI